MTRLTRFVLLVGGLVVAAPSLARAQASEFSIRGLGTPGSWESVRARTTGGAFAAFDPTSALTEASLVEIRSLTASAGLGASYRQVQTTSAREWLRSTRYPALTVAGPISRNVYLGGGFTSYLDRTYDVVTRDSIVLRGVSQPYTDHIASDGGVSDLRLAAGVHVGSHLAVGLGFHLLPGSTREQATRHFDSASYQDVRQSSEVRYTGFGVSGSALVALSSSFSLMAFARTDSHLNRYVGDTLTARAELPSLVGGALLWAPTTNIRAAGSLMWRSWSSAGPNAFNTLNWSAGVERGGSAPLRLGVRGGHLPFGAGTSAPSEWGVSAGVGYGLAQGHGLLDLGIERLARDGDGLHESVWTVLIGMTVRP